MKMIAVAQFNTLVHTYEDVDSVAFGGGFSIPSLLQLGFSFTASIRTFLSNSKSKWKLLRGISPSCGNNGGYKIPNQPGFQLR